MRVVGAVYFFTHNYSDIGPHRTLSVVWIHPYYRGRGLLRKAWPYLWGAEGPFLVEPPLSPAMKGFLRKYTNYEEWLQQRQPREEELAIA